MRWGGRICGLTVLNAVRTGNGVDCGSTKGVDDYGNTYPLKPFDICAGCGGADTARVNVGLLPGHWQTRIPTDKEVMAWSGEQDGKRRMWEWEKPYYIAWPDGKMIGMLKWSEKHKSFQFHSRHGLDGTLKDWCDGRDRMRSVLVAPDGTIEPQPWPLDADGWHSGDRCRPVVKR